MPNLLIVFVVIWIAFAFMLDEGGDGFIGGVVLCFVLFIFAGGCSDKVLLPSEYTKIHSIERGNELQGHFVLGTGGLQSEQKYYFYFEREGGLLLGSADANKTVIYETDTVAPCVKQFRHYRSGWLLDFLCGTNFGLEEGGTGTLDKEVLYVPTNTVRKTFEGKL